MEPAIASTTALVSELRERGFRAEVELADLTDSRVAAVNVWYDRKDRRPAACLWVPYENDGWEWGRISSTWPQRPLI